ncbi:MAG TPA: hypothetical protein VK864_10915 [Longimicrobiales bacterium]|nr:hypothetical protein [Longimicrobiales bacterium]
MTHPESEQALQETSSQTKGTTGQPRRRGRSVAAVAIGFVTVAALSLGTDQVLHVLRVYPPWGEPMREPGLNLLALAYRSVYTVAGMYLTAWLAPHSPMRHALIGGAIGTVVAAAGAVATIPMDLGPAWYPVALAVTALPLAWIGGALYRARARQHQPVPWRPTPTIR